MVLMHLFNSLSQLLIPTGTFPISLENAQTSAYASWVNQRKGDLGPDPLKALSRFFYNNNQYCQVRFKKKKQNFYLKKIIETNTSFSYPSLLSFYST
jgi:hypothetical protein